MNTFETPKWLHVEASRMYLSNFPVTARLLPTLTDDQVIELATQMAEDMHIDWAAQESDE